MEWYNIAFVIVLIVVGLIVYKGNPANKKN